MRLSIQTKMVSSNVTSGEVSFTHLHATIRYRKMSTAYGAVVGRRNGHRIFIGQRPGAKTSESNREAVTDAAFRTIKGHSSVSSRPIWMKVFKIHSISLRVLFPEISRVFFYTERTMRKLKRRRVARKRLVFEAVSNSPTEPSARSNSKVLEPSQVTHQLPPT